MYHKTRLTYDISVMTSFGIPMWISTLSSACTATWDCALHAWCGQSVLWIKIQLTNHFTWTVQKETKAACMSWHRQLLTKRHTVCVAGSFSGRRLKFISLANLFCLHGSMRLRSCFLLAKMRSIEFIQAYIQNSSDHHENFDEKRRNRFACITKHAWHMTYLSWQALEFQREFPPCPQLVRQHETALCMPGANILDIFSLKKQIRMHVSSSKLKVISPSSIGNTIVNRKYIFKGSILPCKVISFTRVCFHGIRHHESEWKFNSSPLKISLPKRKFVFQPSFFPGASC